MPVERARQSEALPLAAGQPSSALADDGVQAGGKRLHEAPGVSGAEALPNERVVRSAVAYDVLADSPVEQGALLEDEPDARLPRIGVDLGERNTVHGNPASCG